MYTGRSHLPGSVCPLATMDSKPSGGLVRVQSSLRIWCSFPRATSLRNMIPVRSPEHRTVEHTEIQACVNMTTRYKNYIILYSG